MRIGRKLTALVRGTERRVLRAEAHFFDAFGRGGSRRGRDLVIPIDYFADARVRGILRAWWRGERELDVDALFALWQASVGPHGPREERLFYQNLVDFVALVHAVPPAPACAAGHAARARRERGERIRDVG